MKRKINSIKTMALAIGIGFALVSCEEPVEPAGQPESEVNLSSILSLKSNLSNIKSSAPGGVSNTQNNSGARASAFKSMKASQARTEDDSVDIDDPWGGWETCAEVSETENEDGSYTIVYDYGDGCYEGDEFWQVFIYGKLTDTYSWEEGTITDNSYSGTSSGTSVYDNFGEKFEDEEYGWQYEISGSSEYSSEFEDSYNDDEFSHSSSNSYKDNLNITEIYDGTSSEISMTSDVEEAFEFGSGGEDKLTVFKGDYTFSDNEGNAYSSKVISPLVMLFNCGFDNLADGENDTEPADDPSFEGYVFTYVSGVEEFTVDGETYTIDYGDGTCDNIVKITNPDGSEEIIDLSSVDSEDNS